MKHRLLSFWKWLKRKKYFVLAIFLFWSVLWFFCLPKHLFTSPYSTILYSNKGELLHARIAEDGQWRFPPNTNVPEKFIKAIIQFEDRTFYSHYGISLRGFGRALIQNISNRRVVSGGSTLSMQLIRMSRGKQRTFWQKMVEMFLSTRLEFRYSKEEILAMYASNAPMGGNVVGLDAASWRYFGTSAEQLSWAETALLAVLPNSPSMLHLSKNRSALKKKRNRLLKRLWEIKEMDELTYRLAIEEPLPLAPKPLPQYAAHLSDWSLKKGKKGKAIFSTIDIELQKKAEQILAIQHNQLIQNQIYNGAILVANYKTGEILAYIGNTPVKEKEHGGEVDIIQASRSSGSILKPFLYYNMVAEGIISPFQLLPDVPTTMGGYSPINYNNQLDGAVPANKSLSRSLNIPFVCLLQEYGVAKFKNKLKKYGVSTVTKSANHYGLSLILGGAEVKLMDLVSAYGVLANGLEGKTFPVLHYDTKENISKKRDNLVLDAGAVWHTIEAMKKLERPSNQSGWKEFSSSRKIAWKTGTSYGFRDAWAVGFNSEYIVGVWVGNADGEGRPGIIGVEAAAPILFNVFELLPKGKSFYKPLGAIDYREICMKSGHLAKKECTVTESCLVSLAIDKTTVCPYHQTIQLDKAKKHRVNSNCYPISEMVDSNWFVLPPKIEWYYQKRDPNYKVLPNWKEDCGVVEKKGTIHIVYPLNKSEIIVVKGNDGDLENVILEAAHQNPEAVIYWHLDDTYLGKTKDIHQIECIPKKGEHTLLLLDDFGASNQIRFKVVNK